MTIGTENKRLEPTDLLPKSKRDEVNAILHKGNSKKDENDSIGGTQNADGVQEQDK